jgi:hypothetical protein
MIDIARRFSGQAVVRPGGLTVYPKLVAMDFINACKEAKVSLLGIDAFYLDGEYIRPSMEDSIDFSSPYTKRERDIYEFAVDFIEHRDPELFFEIVCQEGGE